MGQGLPIGQPTKLSQRDLARQLGMTQQGICKGLKALGARGVVLVVGGCRGTTVTRLV